MSDLLPCSHCGGEAELLTFWDFYKFSCKNADCTAHVADAPYVQHAEGVWYGSIDEARAAWNTRAAYEMDGFFYLPKPKSEIGYTSETMVERTEHGYQMGAIAGVYENAVREWEKQLGQYIVERICEVFKPERTCKVVMEQHNDYGHQTQVDDYTFSLSCGHVVTWDDLPDYCPNCGAKVVSE